MEGYSFSSGFATAVPNYHINNFVVKFNENNFIIICWLLLFDGCNFLTTRSLLRGKRCFNLKLKFVRVSQTEDWQSLQPLGDLVIFLEKWLFFRQLDGIGTDC